MDSCIFCQIARREEPASIVYTDDLVTGLMALHPQNPGHMLVIPNEHVETMNTLAELSSRVFFVGMRLAKTLRDAQSANSCSYLLHDGFDSLHVHLHIIPRHIDDHVQIDQRAAEAPREDLDRIGAQLREIYEATWPTGNRGKTGGTLLL